MVEAVPNEDEVAQINGTMIVSVLSKAVMVNAYRQHLVIGNFD